MTLFASVEGVGIADATALDKSKTLCDTLVPADGGMALAEVSLTDVVQGFLNEGGVILACPMCWAVYNAAAENKRARLIPVCDSPDDTGGVCATWEGQVYSANPAAVLLAADKSFDY